MFRISIPCDRAASSTLALATILAVGALPRAGSAIPIITNPGIDSFTFKNTDARTATDFEVTLKTITGPGIAGGDGGAPFPQTLIGLPKVDAGFGTLTFQGSPGVPPGGTYTVSFPGWPANTVFDVVFTYPPPPNPLIQLISEGHFPTEATVNPAPEPASGPLLATALLGLLAYHRRRALEAYASEADEPMLSDSSTGALAIDASIFFSPLGRPDRCGDGQARLPCGDRLF